MSFTTDPKTALPVLKSAQKLIDDLLILLSEKEKYIIQKRFNLDNTSKSTLEEIGQKYNVTRERIRQIENNALTKLRRNVPNTKLFLINEFIKDILKQSGGIISQDALFSSLVNIFFTADKEILINRNSIVLSTNLDPELNIVQNTINYSPFIHFNHISPTLIKKVSDNIIKHLNKKKKIAPIKNLYKEVNKTVPEITDKQSKLIESILDIDKRVKIIPEGVGLMSWSHVNPKTLKDKIIFILKKEQKPLHFIQIVNKIINFQFDHKRVNTQAVHNELIRQDDFILVGRGLYALQEWGYKKGSVTDVIKEVLKENKELHEDKIVDLVLKQRHVKKITIILNLKNKTQFERIGRKVYKLKNS